MKVIEVNAATGQRTERDSTDAELAVIEIAKQEDAKNLISTNASIISKLQEIDKKKVRALSDFALSGDDSRLRSLEEEADALRDRLAI